MNKDYNPTIKYGKSTEFEIIGCDDCPFQHSFDLCNNEIIFCGWHAAILEKQGEHVILPDFCRLKKVYADTEE